MDLTVPSGQFASIVGPSGSGKSTLLRIIGGLTDATDGVVEVNGRAVTGPHTEATFVFQRPLLLEWMSVIDNVLVPARIKGEVDPAMRDRARDLLELVGIGDFADRLPRELSGGMQQRAAIARALIRDPALLLLDEPFGSLDALTREQMHFELLRIWGASRGTAERELSAKTIVMVTHDIQEAVLLSDVVYVMSARPGRILARVEVGLPRPRTPETILQPEFLRLMPARTPPRRRPMPPRPSRSRRGRRGERGSPGAAASDAGLPDRRDDRARQGR